MAITIEPDMGLGELPDDGQEHNIEVLLNPWVSARSIGHDIVLNENPLLDSAYADDLGGALQAAQTLTKEQEGRVHTIVIRVTRPGTFLPTH